MDYYDSIMMQVVGIFFSDILSKVHTGSLTYEHPSCVHSEIRTRADWCAQQLCFKGKKR